MELKLLLNSKKSGKKKATKKKNLHSTHTTKTSGSATLTLENIAGIHDTKIEWKSCLSLSLRVRSLKIQSRSPRSSERKCHPNQLNMEGQQDTLQGINISHVGKRMNTMNQTQTPSLENFCQRWILGFLPISRTSGFPLPSSAPAQMPPYYRSPTSIKTSGQKKNY